MQADGKISVEVIGTNERSSCSHCGTICVKQRDVPLRELRVELVLYKRRFWCMRCHTAFTESDSACGRRKHTTVRLREEIGQLPTPRFLGVDEFARHKGHRYDTILCDLDARKVLEVSAGR